MKKIKFTNIDSYVGSKEHKKGVIPDLDSSFKVISITGISRNNLI
jgi:hypothetical protein